MNIIGEITISEVANLVIQSINTTILFITAIIVWIYTRAMQESNEIQQKPILNLNLVEEKLGSNTNYILKLKNIGNGPAYNISFFGVKTGEYTYYPYFNEPNLILEKGGADKAVNLWVETQGGGVEVYDPSGFNLFLRRLFTVELVKNGEYDEIARSAAVFLINYDGINGKTYYSIFRIYSKIAPLMPVYDLVVEFIGSGRKSINMQIAKTFCDRKPIMKKNDQ